MTTTTICELRANMKLFFDALDADNDLLIILSQGSKEAIVLMILSEYNSMIKTVYLMSTRENRNVSEASRAEHDNGPTTLLKLPS